MHNKIKGRKLGRTASHKKALLRNLANQLIEHKEIKTTIAKAKEARSHVERLITYAKKGDLHHRRLAFAFLRNKQNINILFDEIAPVYSDRQGGYTRIVKLGNRPGDAAPISLLQLVDFEKVGESPKKKTDKKKVKSAVSKDSKKKDEVETKPVAGDVAVKDEVPEAEVVEDEEKKDQAQQVEEEKQDSNTEKAESADNAKEEQTEAKESDEQKEEDKK